MSGAYVLECTIGNGFPVARNCLIRSVDTVPSANIKIGTLWRVRPYIPKSSPPIVGCRLISAPLPSQPANVSVTRLAKRKTKAKRSHAGECFSVHETFREESIRPSATRSKGKAGLCHNKPIKWHDLSKLDYARIRSEASPVPLARQKMKQIFSLFLFLGFGLSQPLADERGCGDTGDNVI